jgi:hypothetical protein
LDELAGSADYQAARFSCCTSANCRRGVVPAALVMSSSKTPLTMTTTFRSYIPKRAGAIDEKSAVNPAQVLNNPVPSPVLTNHED